MKKTTKRRAFWISTAVVLLLLGGGILARLQINDAIRQTDIKKVTPPRWPRINVGPVQIMDLTDRVTVTGTTKPAQQAALRAEISGLVTKLHADVGDWVKAGSVLLEFEDEQAAASYAVAVANLDAATSEAQFTQFDLESKRVMFNPEVERDFGVSKTEFKRAEFAHAAAEANVRRAESAVEQARVALSKTIIRAPFTGIVTERLVDLGSLVSPGQALFTLTDMSVVKIVLGVSETDLAQLDLGQELDAITVASVRGMLEGAITAINPVADADGLFMVEVTLQTNVLPPPAFEAINIPRKELWPDNLYLREVMAEAPPAYTRVRPDWPARMVFAGVPATVQLPLSTLENAIVVPEEAVVRTRSDEFYVVAVDHVERLVDYFGPMELGIENRARFVYLPAPRFIGDYAVLGQLPANVVPETAGADGVLTTIDGVRLPLAPGTLVARTKQNSLCNNEVVIINSGAPGITGGRR